MTARKHRGLSGKTEEEQRIKENSHDIKKTHNGTKTTRGPEELPWILKRSQNASKERSHSVPSWT
ncbi:hypothetical protein E2C01_084778 [Portunus trituberculatus]|uniref:Uncharacterized protein n=1 Tax=Portunus trituberculatus TaxID=210409 RepID=A0A5B7JA68_PORTR|nr:hypothetical protein [Portunus trituberculatus]